MRLASIGHESARFEDVTLRFTDRAGEPTNSVVWLRNGGGKTSLLSLFFAGVRTHQRDFLGKRAEAKIRSLEDYVGPRDHGVVACEWQLDAEANLFDDGGPRYLSGVFYQRATAHEQNGHGGVERLFFACRVSPTTSELTLEGLPLFSEGPSGKSRRNLSGFRRRLRQLDSEHPALEVFVSDKQNKFEEELASRGIDPDVFYYQVRMNEREGGVLEKFSFAQDEDFIDFLLEMAFSPRRAREVREQLTTFRQELVERNERLKPELECCRGLLARLQGMAAVGRERSTVFRDLENCQTSLRGLADWVSERLQALQKQREELDVALHKAEAAAEDAHSAADRSQRLAASYRRHLAQVRFDAADIEYGLALQARTDAERRKNIWNAARPLAREWEARRIAKQQRDLLAQKLQEHAPQLAELTAAATRFASALAFDARQIGVSASKLRNDANTLTAKAKAARDAAEISGEKAVRAEAELEQLDKQLQRAADELAHLRTCGALLEEEASVEQATARLTKALRDISAEQDRLQSLIVANREIKAGLLAERTAADLAVRGSEKELGRLTSAWEAARTRRGELEASATLLRLLQTDAIDLSSAGVRAVTMAGEELRRITDTILRIRLEAAEDQRALHWLEGDAELLPPSQDVEALLNWLRARQVTCWSGWEYIERNVAQAKKRETAQRLPYLATGVVVASSHYDDAIELVAAERSLLDLHLVTPVAILPTEAITDRDELSWVVVGPTSDGHFDKEAAALDLNRIRNGEAQRQTEIATHESWRDQLSELQHSLRAFLADYPGGWWGRQRQTIDVCQAKLQEEHDSLASCLRQLTEVETATETANLTLKQLSAEQTELVRHLDGIESYARQFGAQVPQWRQQMEMARHEGRQSRQHQAKQKELAEKYTEEARDLGHTAVGLEAQESRLDEERSRVQYVSSASCEPAAGAVDALRSDYQLRLDDYQDKVNAERLSHLAEAMDQEADRAQLEFQEVLSQYHDLSAADVEDELRQLAPGVTAERRFQLADREVSEAFQKLGTVAKRKNPAEIELTEAKRECDTLEASEPLPTPTILPTDALNEAALEKCRQESSEHLQLASAFDAELDQLGMQLTQLAHEREILKKDNASLDSLAATNQDQIARLVEHLAAAAQDRTLATGTSRVRDANDLAQQIADLQSRLLATRDAQQALDATRDRIAQEIGDWSRQERFAKFVDSVSHRFVARRNSELEARATFFATQLDDTVFQIEQKLEEANKHHDRVVDIVLAAVDEGLSLLKQVSSMSRLPQSLPQAGKQFVVIETKAAESPADRRARVGDLIDELIETGDIGKDDVSLIQKAVRRVAGRTKVRVLHPDLHHVTKRVGIAEMRGLSGGERLTAAILLFCALVRLRNAELNRRGSSVLVLDNPIGTASRQSFLDLQREVAHSMNVQLIYATGIKDLSAVGALENVIRLRNSRADRRSGRRLVELEEDQLENGQIETARVTFDKPASSLARRTNSDKQAVESSDEPARD
jgi:DNA repair exonuclease SbcCD ATPase subunit